VKIAITPLPGPEVIAGSTRLKAGTATKLVLNMLTTGAFIRMGYVWGNLMVNVQPKNSKLLDRARRIIRTATGASYDEQAALMLEQEPETTSGRPSQTAAGKRKPTDQTMDKFVIEGGAPLHGVHPHQRRRIPRCPRWPRRC
jgi:hypothetical protein